MADGPQKSEAPSFLKRLVIAVLVIGLALLAWQLRFIVLLAFGAVLLAIIICIAAGGLAKWLKLPSKLAYPLVVILMLGIPLFALWKFGSDIASQADQISNALPSALDRARDLLADAGLAQWVETSINEISSGSKMYNTITGALMTLGDALLNLVVVVVGGTFLASRPQLYRKGFLKLLPARSRDIAGTSLDEMANALGLWLKGRLVAMLLVGGITGLGLWLIGIPSYLALGLLAGLLEFVPFIGPILAAIPAVLLALLGGPADALLVIGLYLLVQQLEGNLITPLIQQRAVDLPPALLIFSVLAFGALFGILGVILAAPLTVVLFVMVKRLYVREFLHTDTPVPGSDD